MYFILLKTMLKETFSLQRLFGRKVQQSKVKVILMFTLLIYAFSTTAFSVGLLHYELALTLTPSGSIDVLWASVFSYMTGVAFLLTFFQAQGYLFQYKDFDVLGPLPVKQKTITLVKVTVMMIFIYLFSSFLVIPIIIVYSLFATLPILLWIFVIFIVFLLPIPMIFIASFVSLGIRKLTQSWIQPQIIQTIFTVLFMIGFVSFTYLQSFLVESGLLSSQFVETVSMWYAPSQWFLDLITTQDYLKGFWIVMSHITLFIVFIQVMSGLTLRTNQSKHVMKFNAKEKIPTKVSPLIVTLMKKEWAKFIGTSIYFLNTGFGLLMLIFAVIASVIFKESISSFLIEFQLIGIEPFWLLYLFSGFSVSTVYTPAVSLSLEGKNFALLKSLPIQSSVLVGSKVAFNMVLLTPVIVLASIGFGYGFSLTVLQILLMAVLLITLSLTMSLFFMWVNLWFPRFDFQTEVEVVKQSIAALIAVFGAILIVVISGLLVFETLKDQSWLISASMMLLFNIFLITLLSMTLFTKGLKVYQKLEH